MRRHVHPTNPCSPFDRALACYGGRGKYSVVWGWECSMTPVEAVMVRHLELNIEAPRSLSNVDGYVGSDSILLLKFIFPCAVRRSHVHTSDSADQPAVYTGSG